METVEIIDEHRRFVHPLTVQLAPESLAPAGIGDSEVQTVRVGVLPVARCHIMPDRILIAVQNELRIARCTGAEEDQHWVGAAWSFGSARKLRTVCGKLGVEIVPALALTVHHDLCSDCICNSASLVNFIC